jgi:eukaryotic translation initiation factor 2C
MGYLRCPADITQFRHFDTKANIVKFELPPSLPPRPKKFNSLGKEISLTLNTFNVLALPTKPVWQYDVSPEAHTHFVHEVMLNLS